MTDTSGYILELCEQFDKVGVCESFEFKGILNRNQAGEWDVQFANPNYQGSGTLEDVDSIIVRKSTGGIVYAGMIVPTVGNNVTGLRRHISPGGTVYELGGVDLFGILGLRIVYPDFENELGSGFTGNGGLTGTWSNAYAAAGGTSVQASTVATRYIQRNLADGNGTPLIRRVVSSKVTVDDTTPVGTNNFAWRSRLDRLDVCVGNVCDAGDIVCDVELSATPTIDYSFRSPSDLADTVRLRLAQLTGTLHVITPAKPVTAQFAAGDGEGASRLFALYPWPQSSEPADLDRVEAIFEARDANDGATLVTVARQEYNKSNAPYSAWVDADSVPLVYGAGEDYQLGDTIGVEIEPGNVVDMDVSSVTFDISPNRAAILPVLGHHVKNEFEKIRPRRKIATGITPWSITLP